MAKVPAGDKTGYYYILVANLPWSCTWQKLKDFARNHPDGTYLNVDHAYVYPGSNQGSPCAGYGWVRMTGKADFKKALAHLNGGVFENRSLQADGRNETETTTLRDIASARQPHPRPRHDSVMRQEFCSPPPTYQQQVSSAPCTLYSAQDTYEKWVQPLQHYANYTPLSPKFSTAGSPYDTPPPSYEAIQSIFQMPAYQNSYAIPSNTVYYVSNMSPVYTCMPPTIAYIPAPTSMHSPNSSSDSNFVANSNIAKGLIQPEARKVIITRLSHEIKDADLNSLVRRVASKYRPRTKTEEDNPIHTIDLPRYPDKKPKGHAFVVYDSQALAEHAVSTLNGMKFQNKSLNAKLAKEGVEPVGGYGAENQAYWPAIDVSSTSSSSPPSSSSSRGLGDRKNSKIHTESSAKEKKSERGEKKECSKAKEEEKGKREEENRTPLVADGSGGRRSR